MPSKLDIAKGTGAPGPSTVLYACPGSCKIPDRRPEAETGTREYAKPSSTETKAIDNWTSGFGDRITRVADLHAVRLLGPHSHLPSERPALAVSERADLLRFVAEYWGGFLWRTCPMCQSLPSSREDDGLRALVENRRPFGPSK